MICSAGYCSWLQMARVAGARTFCCCCLLAWPAEVGEHGQLWSISAGLLVLGVVRHKAAQSQIREAAAVGITGL